MRKTHRLVLIGAALAALAFASPALAGYAPRLAVSSQSQTLGAAGVKIKFTQDSRDDPTQKLSIFVPKSYSITTSAAGGSRVGWVTAGVVAGDIRKALKTT